MRSVMIWIGERVEWWHVVVIWTVLASVLGFGIFKAFQWLEQEKHERAIRHRLDEITRLRARQDEVE